MPNDKIAQLQQGFNTAFIDADLASNLAYKSQFVSHNYKEGRKVLSSVEDELLVCDEFSISVAFITMSGITPLLSMKIGCGGDSTHDVRCKDDSLQDHHGAGGGDLPGANQNF